MKTVKFRLDVEGIDEDIYDFLIKKAKGDSLGKAAKMAIRQCMIYEAAIRLRDEKLRKQAPAPKATKPVNRKPLEFVYLISRKWGLHKIGYSKDPKRRLKELRNEHLGLGLIDKASDMKIVHLIPCDDYGRKVEAALHNKYKKQRKTGEWFALGDEQIKGICSLAKFEKGRLHTNDTYKTRIG